MIDHNIIKYYYNLRIFFKKKTNILYVPECAVAKDEWKARVPERRGTKTLVLSWKLHNIRCV
jgi:hypothetical protein